MTVLRILRGVPGSGKTTHAMQLVSNGWTRVSRDDIRFTLFGRYWGVDEGVVTDVENAAIESALRAGQNTVVDATNLNNKNLKAKLSLASRYGALVEFKDFTVDMATACLQDRARDKRVGDDVIAGFFKRYKIDIRTGVLPPAPEPLPDFEQYVGNPNLPTAYMVDTDGTVADSDGVRSPFDTSKYHLDKPHEHVIGAVRGLWGHDGGHFVIALSARDETYRQVTEQWWRDNGVPYDEFIMRPAGDKRMDALVKYELFMEHVAPKYNVLGVFDDRPQVLRMWRSIGVPTFDVGHGVEF